MRKAVVWASLLLAPAISLTSTFSWAAGRKILVISGPQQTAQQQEKWELFMNYGDEFFRNIRIKPIDHRVEKVKNKYVDGQVDERHTLEYPGLKVVFLRLFEAGAAPRDLLEGLAISDRSIRLPYGVSFGDSPGRVIELLGPPFSQEIDRLIYREKIMELDTLALGFISGRLAKVTWSHWIE